ncbi:L-lactate dehydrogenase [Candidatus Saccharibacteria bacterium]|nr:L-lactate dehydrogenase [Candidatus Saccharibacteria bacterium]
MSGKVMIVGTGNVGASVGYALINQSTAVHELVLTDINAADAEGEAMDLRDTLAVAPNFMKIYAGSYADAADCDIVVITAGVPQKPGESRMDLLKKNAAIFKDMVSQIMASGFNGIFLVVTNPMDVLTQLTQIYSGLPKEQVIGSGTVLDSARLRYRIGERLGASPKSVHAYQVGEHGDTEFALWSMADFGGQPINRLLTPEEQHEIEDFARNEAYTIIEKKGATYYGIGSCVANIIQCILLDERRVLPISSYDEFTDTYFGFPTILGKHGVVRRLELNLTEQEGMRLQTSVNALKTAYEAVKDL